MIDPLASIAGTAPQNSAPQTTKALRMVKNERMGGYVPKWETVEMGAKEEIERNLSLAQNGQDITSFDAALAYQQTHIQSAPEENDSFGFGDIIDMVNPLQHIPLIGHVYRSLTGDEIKPISQIVGGSIFGGPAGAAIGLVNTVIREETGDDMAGNAYSMIAYGKMPRFKTHNSNNPQRALSEAALIAQRQQKAIQDTKANAEPIKIPSPYEDLPAALLAFTPTNYRTIS